MDQIEPHFERFYENLKLTSEQKTDALTKYTGVCEKLHNHYYKTKYDGSTKLLIGSYGKRTNIRPPRDVDVLFKIPKDVFDRFSNNASNGQSQLLQDIRVTLAEKYSTTDKISAWGKVVLVQFKDGTHNIELLPAYEQNDGSFLIPNSEDGGSWENFDPKKDINKIDESDNKTGVTRKMIRMLKKWAEEANVGIKSFQIEDFVVDFLINADLSCPYHQNIYNFFIWLKYRAPQEALSKVDTAISRASKALEFETNERIEDALDEWIKIFGAFFPKNVDKSSNGMPVLQNYELLKSKYPSTKEQDLTKDFGIPVKIDNKYTLQIDATVPHANGFRSTSLLYYLANKLRLKKFKSLTFNVTGINVPKPYDIYWKIRNYGDEALADLRGEITKDAGTNSKFESTRYYGIHTVECYCVKDGICVAYAVIEVPIGND